MRNLLIIITTAILSAIATWFIAWWAMALVIFIVVITVRLRPSKALLFGAVSALLLWLIMILIRDIPNQHILSGRMAKLLGLPNYIVFISVNVFLGAIVGAIAGWSGGLMNWAFRKLNR